MSALKIRNLSHPRRKEATSRCVARASHVLSAALQVLTVPTNRSATTLSTESAHARTVSTCTLNDSRLTLSSSTTWIPNSASSCPLLRLMYYLSNVYVSFYPRPQRTATPLFFYLRSPLPLTTMKGPRHLLTLMIFHAAIYLHATGRALPTQMTHPSRRHLARTTRASHIRRPRSFTSCSWPS